MALKTSSYRVVLSAVDSVTKIFFFFQQWGNGYVAQKSNWCSISTPPRRALNTVILSLEVTFWSLFDALIEESGGMSFYGYYRGCCCSCSRQRTLFLLVISAAWLFSQLLLVGSGGRTALESVAWRESRRPSIILLTVVTMSGQWRDNDTTTR